MIATRSTPIRRIGPAMLIALLLAALFSSAPAHAQDDQPGAGLPPSQTSPTAGDAEREAGWAVAPAGPDGPGLRSAFTYNVRPGQTLRDSVSISNLSSEPITFAIYAKDAFNTEGDGAFALLADEEESTDVGSWVTIKVDTYEIPSGKRADIPFEITVPDDAQPGDHAGGIIAANVDAVDEVEQDGVMLAVRQRVGARIYARVAGPLEPELRVKDLSVKATTPVIPFVGGEGTITYTVENVGNVRLAAATESKVTGLFGRTVAEPGSQDLPELLPGGSVQITETWEGTPPIEPLTAKVSLKSIDGDTTENASAGLFVWSWLVVILAVLVVAALLARWIIRRRRSADADGPDDAAAEAGADDRETVGASDGPA